MKQSIKPIVVVAVSLLGFSALAARPPVEPNLKDPVATSKCSEGQAPIPVCSAEKIVTTASDLEDILRSGYVGCVVIPKDKFIDMTGRTWIPITSNVSLIGERGDLCSRPALYTKYKDEKYPLFELRGSSITVRGIHFSGPAAGDRSSEQPYVHALSIVASPEDKSGLNILIEDNEFNEWTGAGVEVITPHAARTPKQWDNSWTRLGPESADNILITHNFMHHNARDGGGYGVVVGKSAYASIVGNVFDYNRHAVASDGFAYTGYIARFNYVLEGGFQQGGYWNQHFDVHGTNDANGDNQSTGYGGSAGEYYEIAYNTIRGEQTYYVWKTRPAFMLRGRSTIGSYFDANVCAHDDLDSAVALKMADSDTGFGEDQSQFNFFASGNSFNVDHSDELAVGDFDGDKRSDVFVATGTAWFFSPGGVAPWIFLHASNKLTSELGFADIDNDGVTDVLYRDGAGNVGWLRSGRVALQPLTTSPVSMKDMRFGDFDGDKLTDIFTTQNGFWRIWYGSTHTWTQTQQSNYPITAFRFGEFDAIKGTDVVVETGGEWDYSSGAIGYWVRLNDSLGRLSDAVVADFNGDGASDIAVDAENQIWYVSYSGRGKLKELRLGPGQTAYPSLSTLLTGNFDGDASAEVVSFFDPYGTGNGDGHNHFGIWRGDYSEQLFDVLSEHEMR